MVIFLAENEKVILSSCRMSVYGMLEVHIQAFITLRAGES